jgi:hypothetical protein
LFQTEISGSHGDENEDSVMGYHRHENGVSTHGAIPQKDNIFKAPSVHKHVSRMEMIFSKFDRKLLQMRVMHHVLWQLIGNKFVIIYFICKNAWQNT